MKLENKQILKSVIENNSEKIDNMLREIIKASFLSPSFSGWSYRVVAFVNGTIDYMLCNNGRFMAEHEGEAICIASVNADYGNDVDLGSVTDSLDIEEYENYKKWYMTKEDILEEDLDERYLNDWSLVLEYDKDIYNTNLEAYIDYCTDGILENLQCKIDDTLENHLNEENIYQ